MRFNLDVPVERRVLKPKPAIKLDLEFPAPASALEASRDWQARSADLLKALRPGRVPDRCG